jgi:hypothetical protein
MFVIKKHGFEVTFSGMVSTEFHKNLLSVSKSIREADKRIDGKVIS